MPVLAPKLRARQAGRSAWIVEEKKSAAPLGLLHQ
jgi:hypothetical protein